MATFNKAVTKDDHQKFIEEKKRKIQEKLAAAQNKLAQGNNTPTANGLSNSSVSRTTSAL